MSLMDLWNTVKNNSESPVRASEKTGGTICHPDPYDRCVRLVGGLQGTLAGGVGPPLYRVILPYPTFGQNDTLKARAVRSPYTKSGWRGQMYDANVVKVWQSACRAILATRPRMPLDPDYRYGMLIAFYMPDDLRDIDSMEKKVIDILQKYAYHNDRRVMFKMTEKVLIRELPPNGGVEPCVDVTVWRIR